MVVEQASREASASSRPVVGGRPDKDANASHSALKRKHVSHWGCWCYSTATPILRMSSDSPPPILAAVFGLRRMPRRTIPDQGSVERLCLAIAGEAEPFERLQPVIQTLAEVPEGFQERYGRLPRVLGHIGLRSTTGLYQRRRRGPN